MEEGVKFAFSSSFFFYVWFLRFSIRRKGGLDS